MITAVKVCIFATVGYAILRCAILVYKALIGNEEVLRIKILPKDYMLKKHKAVVLMGCMCLLCQVVAVGALAVAAIMWAVGA